MWSELSADWNSDRRRLIASRSPLTTICRPSPPGAGERHRGRPATAPDWQTRMHARLRSALVCFRLAREDAVAPAAKETARPNIVAGLTELDWGQTVRAVRINGVDTSWCYGDLIEVVAGAGASIDVIIIPKIKAPRDVWFVDDLLTQ